METALVFETVNSMKADMAEGLLKSNDIAFERRAFGAGSNATMVFGGSDNAGIRFYVAAEDYAQAEEILGAAGFLPNG